MKPALSELVELRDGVLFWRRSGRPIKLQTDRDGYLKFTATYEGRPYYWAAHRAIWFLHHGTWPTHGIDHINRARDDNRIENLRDVPHVENMRNSLLAITATGVNFDKRRGKWCATFRGKYLGSFATREEAVAARAQAKQHSATFSPVGCAHSGSGGCVSAQPGPHS